MHPWISSASLLLLHSWRAHLDFHKLEEGLEEGRRWPVLACNPVNCSLTFLITFLWIWIYTAIAECISLYRHHFKIKIELLYWVRPMVHPGQHPLPGCQGKEHVGTGAPLLCSSLPVHGPSCSTFKSCLQILVVSDCLQISFSEIHLVFFWTDWHLSSPQHPVPMKSTI